MPRKGSGKGRNDDSQAVWSGRMGGSRSTTPDMGMGGGDQEEPRTTLGEVRDTAERLERTIKELVRIGVWDEVAKNLPPHRGAKTSDSGLWPTSNISIERSSLFDGWVRRDFAGLLRRLGAEPVDTQSGQSDHDIQMYVMGDTRGDKDLGSLCVKIYKARIVVAGRCKKWEEMMSRQGVSGSASQRMLHALLAMARAENKKMMKNWTPSVSAYRSRDRSKSRPGDKRPREERREEEGERGRAKKERKTEGKKAEQEEEEDAFGMQVLDVSLFKRGGKGAKEEKKEVKEEGGGKKAGKEEVVNDQRVTRSHLKAEDKAEVTPKKGVKKGGKEFLTRSPSFVGGVDAKKPFRSPAGEDFENPLVMEVEYLAAYQLITAVAIMENCAEGKGVSAEEDRQAYNLTCHCRDSAWDLIIIPDLKGLKASDKNENEHKAAWGKALEEGRKMAGGNLRKVDFETKVHAEAQRMCEVVDEINRLNSEGQRSAAWKRERKKGDASEKEPTWLRLKLQETGLTPASPQWMKKLQKMKDEVARKKDEKRKKEEEERKRKERMKSGLAIVSNTIFDTVWKQLQTDYDKKREKLVQDAMGTVEEYLEARSLNGTLESLQIQILDRCQHEPTGRAEPEADELEVRTYDDYIQIMVNSHGARTRNLLKSKMAEVWNVDNANDKARELRGQLVDVLDETGRQIADYVLAFEAMLKKYDEEYKAFEAAKQFKKTYKITFDDIEVKPAKDNGAEEKGEESEEPVVKEEEGGEEELEGEQVQNDNDQEDDGGEGGENIYEAEEQTPEEGRAQEEE